MKVFEALNEPTANEFYNLKNIKLFLAGGITNCDDWQSKVIDELNAFSLDDLMIFNPRRKHFDVSDKNASQKQNENLSISIVWISLQCILQIARIVFNLFACTNLADTLKE